MIEDRITYEMKDNGWPVRSLTITGTYNLDVSLDVEPHTIATSLPEFHDFISTSIQRQVLFDLYGTSVSKFNEKQNELIIRALGREQIEGYGSFSKEEMTPPFSKRYSDFKIREDLIYQLRTQK